jgi:hypothetical protein
MLEQVRLLGCKGAFVRLDDLFLLVLWLCLVPP